MLACQVRTAGVGSGNNNSNAPVAFMMRALDFQSSHFGYAPLKWQTGIGSAAVARLDRGPLQPIDVEALSYLSQFRLQEDFEYGSEQGWPKARRNAVLAKLTPERYKEYLGHYLKGSFVDELD